MIKKLRFKLIAASMLSLFLVLFVIMGAVNILNYREILLQADSTLSILKENEGAFPKKEDGFHKPGGPGPKPISPELPYESRYFSVLLSLQGEVISSDTGKIAAIDTSSAVEFAKTAYRKASERGFIGDYRYICSIGEDNVRVIFLDCTRSLSTFRSFLLASCIISAIGLLAVFGLIVVLSRRIVRPVLRSYEKQKQFITNAGHEIKTPITIIDADAEVLELEFGSNEWLNDIKTQAKRLSSLTNDLIYLSRMEEDSLNLNMIEFPFSDIVGEIANSFKSLSKTQSKNFETDIQPMISICGNEKSLRQLLSILLDNALKYSASNGSIRLALKRQGKMACLTVENTTANSIQKENLDCIFDRFYRLDQSRNSSNGGYGLGLCIAKAIVDNHKGKISASSIDAQTFTIKVLLPIS